MTKTRRKRPMSPVIFVVLALVAALLAGLSAVVYTSSVEARVVKNLEPVSVVVASTTILPGTTLRSAVENGLTKVSQYPAEALPEGVLRPGDLTLGANEVTRTVLPGEPLLASLFPTRNEDQNGIEIPEGFLATTIEVNNAAKVGSFLQPYDYVIVYLSTTGANDRPVTSVLLQKALVLAVGDVTKRGQKQTAEQAPTVTLGLSPADSLTLVSGLRAGNLYLGLLPSGTVGN